MGNRSPNAGGAGISTGWLLAVHCEVPVAGGPYSVDADHHETITDDERDQLIAAIVGHDAAAVDTVLAGSDAALWWARAAPVLLAAWPGASSAAETLWSAPGAAGPTEWTWAPMVTY